MASINKRGTTVLAEVRKGRSTLAVLRSDAHILRRRPTGGHMDAGRVKADMTIDQLADLWRRKYPDADVYTYAPGGFVPNPAAKQAASAAAAGKRQKAYADAKDVARKVEAEFGPESAPLPDGAALYIATAMRDNAPILDGRCRYVAGMAKFHGTSSGWLGTAIAASYCVPKDYPYRDDLDAMADRVAVMVYGDANRAARAWSGLLGNSKGVA